MPDTPPPEADKRFCRTCRYDLSRTTRPACPECGRAFDALDPNTFTRHPGLDAWPAVARRWIGPLTAVPLIWLGLFLGPLSVPLTLAFVALLLGMIGLRHWRGLALSLALCPLLWAYAGGVLSYGQGTARTQGMGLPRLESFNLDPITRYPYASGGCRVTGREWMILAPNNLAIEHMYRLFGLMPGAYDGPYPDHAQARQALTQGEHVRVQAIAANDLVVTDSQTFALDSGVGEALLQQTEWAYQPDIAQRTLGPMTAALYQQRCLVLRIPEFGDTPGTPHGFIALIDLQNGRPFAFYNDDHSRQYFPPARYRP